MQSFKGFQASRERCSSLRRAFQKLQTIEICHAGTQQCLAGPTHQRKGFPNDPVTSPKRKSSTASSHVSLQLLDLSTSAASSKVKRCASGCTWASLASTFWSSNAFWLRLQVRITVTINSNLCSMLFFTPEWVFNTVHPRIWLLLILLQLQCSLLCFPFDATDVLLHGCLVQSQIQSSRM